MRVSELDTNASTGETALKNTRQEQHNLDMDGMFVNISDWQLSDIKTAVLARWEKFAVGPKRIPVEDIIGSVEAGMR